MRGSGIDHCGRRPPDGRAARERPARAGPCDPLGRGTLPVPRPACVGPDNCGRRWRCCPVPQPVAGIADRSGGRGARRKAANGSIIEGRFGLGHEADVQARVFEPFISTKGEGGSRLDLAMVFGMSSGSKEGERRTMTTTSSRRAQKLAAEFEGAVEEFGSLTESLTLEDDPALQGQTLFGLLCERRSGRFQEGNCARCSGRALPGAPSTVPSVRWSSPGPRARRSRAVRLHLHEQPGRHAGRRAVCSPGLPPGAGVLEHRGRPDLFLGELRVRKVCTKDGRKPQLTRRVAERLPR